MYRCRVKQIMNDFERDRGLGRASEPPSRVKPVGASQSKIADMPIIPVVRSSDPTDRGPLSAESGNLDVQSLTLLFSAR
jgi:hypothetical protein